MYSLGPTTQQSPFRMMIVSVVTIPNETYSVVHSERKETVSQCNTMRAMIMWRLFFFFFFASLSACVHVHYIILKFPHLIMIVWANAGLLVDFRPVGVVSESNGTVNTCVYVCDGQLKRNASVTVTFADGSAQCES